MYKILLGMFKILQVIQFEVFRIL